MAPLLRDEEDPMHDLLWDDALEEIEVIPERPTLEESVAIFEEFFRLVKEQTVEVQNISFEFLLALMEMKGLGKDDPSWSWLYDRGDLTIRELVERREAEFFTTVLA